MTALSIPTWVIHISSVIEWVVAIWLIWTYSQVTGNRSWQGLAIAMLPALVSAMCACTWHFFDNAPQLEWLVTLQAAMTLVGNITLCLAGWWIWKYAQPQQAQQPGDRPSALLSISPVLTALASKETLFALSLFPYLGFLWFLTRSKQAPRLALLGFYMTLVFVAITIPAGIYAERVYGEALANVDGLHGGAELFLTLSNILVALGFWQAIQQHQKSPS